MDEEEDEKAAEVLVALSAGRMFPLPLGLEAAAAAEEEIGEAEAAAEAVFLLTAGECTTTEESLFALLTRGICGGENRAVALFSLAPVDALA